MPLNEKSVNLPPMQTSRTKRKTSSHTAWHYSLHFGKGEGMQPKIKYPINEALIES